MTETSNNTTAAALNATDELGTAIQKKAGQLQHLLSVCEETYHSLDRYTVEGRIEAADRIGSLLDLAGSIAGELLTLGEQVEFAPQSTVAA